MAQYLFHKARERRGSHWNRFGPFYLVMISIPLTTVDLLRHCLVDGRFLFTRYLRTYSEDCYDDSGFYGIPCLTMVAWIGVACTWTGFACLIVGLFWGLGIVGKFKRGFKAIRKAQGYQSLPDSAP